MHTMKLGDIVHVVVQPFAETTDAILGTDVANCGGCQKRRQQLNDWGDSIYDELFEPSKPKDK